MRILIDTHTFLWFIEAAPEISPRAKSLIEDKSSEVLISVASLWELSIKTSIGKLTIDGGYARVLSDLNANLIDILPIDFSHTLENNRLPFHHKDPFDRLIAAQAIVEKIDLISRDVTFDPYFSGTSSTRLW